MVETSSGLSRQLDATLPLTSFEVADGKLTKFAARLLLSRSARLQNRLPIIIGRTNNRGRDAPWRSQMQKRSRNNPSLDNVVVHLLHRVSQRADELFVKEVGNADLTPRQFVVLLSVAESDAPSQTDLVETTGIDRSTIAEMVRRMAKRRLLQRRRSRKDARAYVVQLTDAGREVLKATEPKALRTDTAVLACLNGEQRRVFVETLKIISGS
jgi:DNA-binding MarR family transcriptional regulator